jgi:hypothetical protein
VSLLKQQVGTKAATSTEIPEYKSNHPFIQPQAALDFRGNINSKEVLIHWQGFNLADATWENVAEFQVRFPDFVLEDKDPLNGGGML